MGNAKVATRVAVSILRGERVPLFRDPNDEET